jgi:DNA-binding IclR family transcriptional regulator
MSQTVERAIGILELLSTGPKRPADVAAELGVHRTTALRLMQDLVNGGLARRTEDGAFVVGYRLVGLAHAVSEQFDLRDITHPRIQELAAALKVTVHIGVIDGDRIVYADKAESFGAVRLYSEIGRSVRLHASGVGKALLAWAADEDRERLLATCAFERFTPATVVGAAAFAEHLREIRERGFATDDGEYEGFVNCVAVPIRNAAGGVTSALSVTAVKEQFGLDVLTEQLPLIRETTAAISQDLGWRER